MNAAEKARLAGQRQKQEGQKKVGVVIVTLLTIAYVGLVVSSYIFQIIGYNQFTNEALKNAKLFFWIGIACIVLGMLLIGLDTAWADKYKKVGDSAFMSSSGITLIAGAAVVVLCIITLFKGTLAIQEYHILESDGVVYAQKKNDVEFMGVLDKADHIIIRNDIEGYTLDEIEANQFKGNSQIKIVEFIGGDLKIGKNAFAECSKLEVVKFDKYTYEIQKGAFKECSRLKEFNIGKATVKCHNATDNYTYTNDSNLFGSKTNATIIINGGTLDFITDDVKTYKIGQGSTIEIKTCYESDMFGNNCGQTFNSVVVFEEGFTFAGSTIFFYMDQGIFTSKPAYYAFGYEIYIPKSVTSIPSNFLGDKTLKDKIKIYYAGTEAEWNNVSISSEGNSNFDNGKVEVIYNTPYTE